jgi:hypothetical protein
LSAAAGAGRPAEAGGGGWSAADDPLARAVFALLVLAAIAAFFNTQGLKHSPTPVQRFERTPTFSPGSPNPLVREERISFKLASADSVTVSVVNSSNLAVVATLVRDHPLQRYKQFSLHWNGRRGEARRFQVLVSASGHRTLVPINEGAPAPPGEYRVRVDLRHQDREIYSPWSFTLVRP